MWHQLKQPERKCRSNVWEQTTNGCKFQEAWFVGGKNIFWKLYITVIIFMGVEHDWWDNLYTHCQLFDPKNLIGTCLIDSRKLLLIPVLPPFRHSQRYFCWHVFLFLSHDMKAACSAYFRHICHLQNCVISPSISLCVLECDLSSYLKFKYCPGLLFDMSVLKKEVRNDSCFLHG